MPARQGLLLRWVSLAVGGAVVFGWEVGFALGVVSGLFAAYAWREELIGLGRRVAGDGRRREGADARRAFVAGEIDIDELERRLDYALDDRQQVVTERALRASGVGPVLARSLAEEFRTAERIADADVEEIADRVTGIGPDRAREIAERFN